MGNGQRSGPPSWFVILVGIAIVFGVYYLWVGLRNFMTSGVSVSETTQQAIERSTATAMRIQEIVLNAPTPLPSFTPVPPCQEFIVRVPIAIVRATPSLSGRIVEGLREGETVCVLAMLPDSEWYLIDQNARTRRIEQVYMHRDIIRAVNPTPRPTATPIPTDTSTPNHYTHGHRHPTAHRHAISRARYRRRSPATALPHRHQRAIGHRPKHQPLKLLHLCESYAKPTETLLKQYGECDHSYRQTRVYSDFGPIELPLSKCSVYAHPLWQKKPGVRREYRA